MTPDLLSSLNKNGTGLQLRELAQTLATAETVPRIERLQRAQDADTLRLSGLGQVRAQLDQLGTRLAEAAGNPVLTVESSTAMLAPRVTDRAALTNGSMFVDVTNLAQPQVLEFSGFTGADQPLAAGSLTLEFGAWSEDAFNANPDREAITIDVAEGATLQDMVRQLDALPGVSAQLFDKGDGTFSLGVASDTGAENALRITAQDLGGPGQALTAFDNASDNQARQVQAARDAQLTVNGISVTRPSNTIADVVPGVELTLNGATSGVLDIGRSETAARQNLQSLVDGLNDTFGLLREVTRNGIGDEARGDLAGDGNLQALDSALRRLVSEPIAGFDDEPVTLAELGVATNRDGSLRLDPPAFDRAFAARAADFDVLFQNKLRALSGQAEVSGNPQAALPAGDYRFAVDGQGRATLDGARMSGFETPWMDKWSIPFWMAPRAACP